MTLEVLKGVFREDAWATPLLALSVIVLCALLLYTVLGLCSRIGGGKPSPDPSLNNSSFWTSFDVSWLQMPLILGLMTLASTCIVAAVPLNEAACRILFLGPGIGHVLLAAGLLSRIVQHSIKTHIVLQWLLLFFVILNQVIISAAYLHRSWTTLSPISNQQRINTTNAAFKAQANCQLTVHDQLLVMLYPALLVAVVLLLVYRTARRTRSQWKSREAIHAGLAASFAGAFTGCWLGAASVLGDAFLPSCLGYGCLATVIVVALISLIPRSSSEAFAEAAVERIGDTFRRHRTRQPARVRLSPATSSGSTSSEPGPSSRAHHNNYSNNKDVVNHHQLVGRGTEKSLPNDPEIFIVPMAPSDAGGRRQVVAVPVSDIAVQAIKAHHNRHHHHRASNRSFQHHQRNHHNRESGRYHHRHQHHPPGGVGYQWNGKLMRSNLSASNRRLNKTVRMMRQDVGAGSRSGIMRNVSDRVPSSSGVILEHSEEAANQQQLQLNQNYMNNGRTPYNHRGWLY